MCRGLQHAHELQIIHRDLKPENVMLVPDGTGDGGEPRYRAVVMDFGLAKERRAGPEVAKLTATGIVLGTPEFMSPEQIRGKPLDGRSDVYALGILAFELFTGQLPFAGKSAQETMIARLRGSPAKLRDLRPELPAQARGGHHRGAWPSTPPSGSSRWTSWRTGSRASSRRACSGGCSGGTLRAKAPRPLLHRPLGQHCSPSGLRLPSMVLPPVILTNFRAGRPARRLHMPPGRAGGTGSRGNPNNP